MVIPQSPKRVFLYGLGVWVGLVAVSLVLLPFEGDDDALYESIKAAALVAIALGFTIGYLRAVARSSAAEGVLVGVLWAAVVLALDLGLYALGAFTIGLGEYFTDVASSYLAIPVVTTLAMGFLVPRVPPSPSGARRGAAAEADDAVAGDDGR